MYSIYTPKSAPMTYFIFPKQKRSSSNVLFIHFCCVDSFVKPTDKRIINLFELKSVNRGESKSDLYSHKELSNSHILRRI